MTDQLRPPRRNRAQRRARQYGRRPQAPCRDSAAVVLARHYATAAAVAEQAHRALQAQADRARRDRWQVAELRSWAATDRAAQAALDRWQALLSRSWQVESRAELALRNDRAPRHALWRDQLAEIDSELVEQQLASPERCQRRHRAAPPTPLRSELRTVAMRSHAPCRAERPQYRKAARP